MPKPKKPNKAELEKAARRLDIRAALQEAIYLHKGSAFSWHDSSTYFSFQEMEEIIATVIEKVKP